jgi:hypothetical protein
MYQPVRWASSRSEIQEGDRPKGIKPEYIYLQGARERQHFALGSLTPPESRQHQLKAEHSLHTAPLVPMYPADGIIHRAMGLVDMVHRAITHTPGLGYILSPCGIVMCLI